MEICINIKLEDADIALVLKSLFEILKKIPSDKVDIKTDQYVPPYKPPSPYTPADNPFCGNVVDLTRPCGCVVGETPNCPCQLVVDPRGQQDTATSTLVETTTTATQPSPTYDTLKDAVCAVEEDVYFSDNGETVKKIDEKKN